MELTITITDVTDTTQIARARHILDAVAVSLPVGTVTTNPATKPAKTPKAEAPAPAPAALDDVKPSDAKVYTGEELRKAAAEKAKALGKDGAAKVKAFVASLGVKSITEVAPEKSAAAMERLLAVA